MNQLLTKEHLYTLNVMIPVTGDDGGNYTELQFHKEKSLQDSMLIKKKCSTVLNYLAKITFCDLVNFRQKYGETFNRKNGIPVSLHPSVSLMPLKIRDAAYKDQGTIGYINACAIKYIQLNTPGITTIIFQDESRIDVMQSEESVNQLRIVADMIHYYNFKDYKGFLN